MARRRSANQHTDHGYRTRLLLPITLCLATGCYIGVDSDGAPQGETGSDGAQRGSEGGDANGDEGEDSSSSGGEPEGTNACDAAPTPRVWRLTAEQYDRTLASIFAFGPDERWSANFPADAQSYFFANNSDVLLVPPPMTLELSRTAELIVERVFESPEVHLEEVWMCDPSELDLDTPPRDCTDAFLAALGRRVYRRPLTTGEMSSYFAIVDAAQTQRRGIELAVEAMLQSPYFLYRTELASPTDGEQPQWTDFETISFLSLTLWNQGPDDALLDLAEGGFGEDDYADLVGRVLDDERAAPVFSRFFADWLDLDHVEALSKPEDPRDSAALSAAMAQEVTDYIDHIMNEEGGTQAEIFSSRTTIYNSALAEIYGDLGAADGDVVELPSTERAGLLTLPGWLATYAEPDHPTPISRGVFVRRRLMCQDLPPVPPGVDASVPPPIPGQTTRERFDRHSSDPTCAGCHVLIDPVGFLFSNYDSMGAFITEEEGQPVDASGEIVQSKSFDGPYDGAVDMLEQLATSEDLTQCLPEQMYKFVYGQTAAVREDECALDELGADYTASDGDIRGVLEDMLIRRLRASR